MFSLQKGTGRAELGQVAGLQDLLSQAAHRGEAPASGVWLWKVGRRPLGWGTSNSTMVKGPPKTSLKSLFHEFIG